MAPGQRLVLAAKALAKTWPALAQIVMDRTGRRWETADRTMASYATGTTIPADVIVAILREWPDLSFDAMARNAAAAEESAVAQLQRAVADQGAELDQSRLEMAELRRLCARAEGLAREVAAKSGVSLRRPAANPEPAEGEMNLSG